MSTIIVGVFVIAILWLALRCVIRNFKTGGCADCPQKSRDCSCAQASCHCASMQSPNGCACAQDGCDSSRSQTMCHTSVIKML